jgi:aspartate aminotransferase-like enzyme
MTVMTPYDEISANDMGPFKEYSVIYTDRALNLMSPPFQNVMKDLNTLLRETYHAYKVAIIPGSGTFAMEAVARQFATNEHVLVIRNGWFSFRWTEIFDMGSIPNSHSVLKAQAVGDKQYAPHPIDDVISKILEEKPAVVFAPHVETSTGMILSEEYIQALADAVHKSGGLLVLDCIASGTVWLDMKKLGIDVLISAPQKGWSGPACCGLVMLSAKATARMATTEETSFSLSLKKWVGIMDMYKEGGFGYHTTMPTDALRSFHNISVEMMSVGMSTLKQAQIELGKRARLVLESKGLVSVAAPSWEAPGVLVFYTPSSAAGPVSSADIIGKFKQQGLQLAAGVPWRIDEPEGVQTFRVGLFGLDKLKNMDETVRILEEALDQVLAEKEETSVRDSVYV